jgi:hypothetical protein
MNEAGLLGAHKLWTGNLFSDLGSGARMVIKGKIPLVPHVIKGRAQLARLFEAQATGTHTPTEESAAADGRST